MRGQCQRGHVQDLMAAHGVTTAGHSEKKAGSPAPGRRWRDASLYHRPFLPTILWSQSGGCYRDAEFPCPRASRRRVGSQVISGEEARAPPADAEWTPAWRCRARCDHTLNLDPHRVPRTASWLDSSGGLDVKGGLPAENGKYGRPVSRWKNDLFPFYHCSVFLNAYEKCPAILIWQPSLRIANPSTL